MTTLKVLIKESMNKSGNNRLRREGYLPGSISTKGEESVSVAVRRDDLRRAIADSGMSAVLKLEDDKGTAYHAMIGDIQTAPLTQAPLHVDFKRVFMTEETRINVAIQPTNREPLDIERLEFLQHLDQLSVRGLPGDIPNVIEVDIGNMKAGDNLYVADIPLPDKISTDTEGDRLVFTVSMPRVYTETETGEAAETPAAEETPATEDTQE